MTVDPSRNIVVSFVGQNENQTLVALSSMVGGWLKAKGYNFRLINLFSPQSGHELMTLLMSGQVAFGFGYAGVGSRIDLKTGVNLWAASCTPFLSLWYDHPAYNYLQHMVDSPYVAQCYHIRDHFEARQKYLSGCASQAVMIYMKESYFGDGRSTAFAGRSKRILYTKSGLNPEVYAEGWQRHPAKFQEILWALVDQVKRNPNIDLSDAAASMVREAQFTQDNLEVQMGAVHEVDAYIRGWRSDKLARALLRHPADIVGAGWGYLQDQADSRATFFPPVDALEYAESIYRYRVVANSSPLWRDGVHERVYQGLSSGAIVMTDHTVKSDRLFHGLPNVISYDWRDDLEDVIATSLSLAEKDVDYLPLLPNYLPDRTFSHVPDYVCQLEAIVEALRDQRAIVPF